MIFLGVLCLVYIAFRISSNMFWCFVVAVFLKHLSSIHFRSLRMKLTFDFSGIVDW